MARQHLIILGLVTVLLICVKTQTPIFPVSCYLNVLVILDRSDSVKGGFNRSRNFVVNVSEELDVGPDTHRVAMIVYSGLSYRREVFKWNFAKNNEEFRKIVLGLRAIGGTTNTKKALELGLELMETRNKSIPTLIMVVTDGRSADDPKIPAQQLQQIPNTWVFAAATGDPDAVDKNELLEITGNINHIILQSGRKLAADITRKLLRQAQEKCRTTTTTTTTTTATTTTTNPISGCEQDVVLVMDLSTTTNPVYRKYIEMAEELINRLLIGRRFSRIALITFSSVGKTRTQFNLDRYFNGKDIVTAIRRLESSGGTTAVGEGIRLGIEQKDKQHGGRPNEIAKKAMLVFTDGWSNKGPDVEEMSRNAKGAGFTLYTVVYEGDGHVDTNSPGLNLYTIETVANDRKHVYSERNFTQLIQELRQRNLPCI
ncbi:unnamed protein product [Wuchereria bancrofti]|uniref:VWFA domain-containing protein n=1 Tax=Wuchereria bancrofti TaxID=6293 RepID=A0A3P7EYF5_WUCBA|nr:unnamed protein product [Wuchereria bancrofti]